MGPDLEVILTRGWQSCDAAHVTVRADGERKVGLLAADNAVAAGVATVGAVAVLGSDGDEVRQGLVGPDESGAVLAALEVELF